MAEVWAPTLEQVANYIPRSTIDVTTPGDATELGTFTANTKPTHTEAARFIDWAVAQVLSVAPAIPGGLYPLAAGIAAKRAAAAILRSRSDFADDLAYATALDAQADGDLARLLSACVTQPQGRVTTAQANARTAAALGAALANVGQLATPEKSLLSRRTNTNL